MLRKLFLAIVITLFLGADCVAPPTTTAPQPVPQEITNQNINAAAPTKTTPQTATVPQPKPRAVVNQNTNVASPKTNTTTPTTKQDTVPYAPNGTYKNVDGNEVPSPYQAPQAPVGASAQCRDGTYSFSQHRSGTCSHHGGVATWL